MNFLGKPYFDGVFRSRNRLLKEQQSGKDVRISKNPVLKNDDFCDAGVSENKPSQLICELQRQPGIGDDHAKPPTLPRQLDSLFDEQVEQIGFVLRHFIIPQVGNCRRVENLGAEQDVRRISDHRIKPAIPFKFRRRRR